MDRTSGLNALASSPEVCIHRITIDKQNNLSKIEGYMLYFFELVEIATLRIERRTR